MMRRDLSSLVAGARPAVFWTDRSDSPDDAPTLIRAIDADLVIIGAGFSGLWAALQAVEEHPGRSIVVLEAERTGFGASTRNGGFCDPSLTHGLLNGIDHWRGEIITLQRMAKENFEGLLASVAKHNIDAGLYRTDEVDIATAPWHLEDLQASAETHDQYGEPVTLLAGDEARTIADSPTYLGALVHHDAIALVDPARLAWGLRAACERLGVRFFDRSRVLGVEEDGSKLKVVTGSGSVAADRVVVATNAWAEPQKKIRRYVIPVYDHVLMTEPLGSAQMDAVGWHGREGLSDAANQFHYYRLTEDNRILWGGYDANYYRGNGMGPEYEQRRASHELIAGHFFDTFPQLEGLGFSHRWAGPIATTSRFTAAWGTEFDGRLAWVSGYTGLGVAASRFGARVALDLVDGRKNGRTQLKMVRKKPVPFPPEPLRNAVVQFTRGQIAKADANEGKPGPWLTLLDAFGVGFDS